MLPQDHSPNEERANNQQTTTRRESGRFDARHTSTTIGPGTRRPGEVRVMRLRTSPAGGAWPAGWPALFCWLGVDFGLGGYLCLVGLAAGSPGGYRPPCWPSSRLWPWPGWLGAWPRVGRLSLPCWPGSGLWPSCPRRMSAIPGAPLSAGSPGWSACSPRNRLWPPATRPALSCRCRPCHTVVRWRAGLIRVPVRAPGLALVQVPVVVPGWVPVLVSCSAPCSASCCGSGCGSWVCC